MYLERHALPCAPRANRQKSRERARARSLWCSQGCGLLAQTARDVAENVLDLVAKDDQDDDDDHRDQNENKGVLDHTLPFLTVEQCTKAEIKVGQHAGFTSLGRRSNGPSFTPG